MNLPDRAAKELRADGIESPRAEARLLLGHALGLSQEDILAGRAEPDAAGLARFEGLLARRRAHEPLAYIVGRREFWSLDFAVGPGVLIPRPETETLVEQAMKAFPAPDAALDVLDLGTGSGCLLLAFLSERRQARGTGIDRSPQALAWATRNAENLGLAGRTRFLQADFEHAPEGPFDVVFANPPYIETADIAGLAPDVARYEPLAALDGGPDGLNAYRSIARILSARLRVNGRAFVEIGQGQAEQVSEIFSAADLNVVKKVPDLAGIPRCLTVLPAVPAAP